MDKNRRDGIVAEIVAEIDALLAGHAGRDQAVSPDAMRVAPDGAADLDVEPESITDVYGEVIDSYTRADAIADGSQVEVPAGVCREVRIAVPATLTRAAWEGCVAWTEEDAERTGVYQDQDARLFDVMWMGSLAVRRVRRTRETAPDPIPFTVCRVARDTVPGEDGVEPDEVRLWIVLGADVDGSPCVTIMQPGEL